MKRLARLCYVSIALAFAMLGSSGSKAQLVFTASNESVYPGGAGAVNLSLTNNGSDLQLQGFGASMQLTSNPSHDVKLNQSQGGSDGQFNHFFSFNPFTILAGQTITLATDGFSVPFSAAQNVVGIHLSDLVGFGSGSPPLGIVGAGVDGSITILGPQLVFTADNVSVSPGGHGMFHIELTNTGPALSLAGLAVGALLTNNPLDDVKLDVFQGGSDGQFFHFLSLNPFSMSADQTIDLETVGFSAAPGAAPNVVGISLQEAKGFVASTLGPPESLNGSNVNGSITVLGVASVPEPGALVLFVGMLIPGFSVVLRRRR